MPRSIVDLLDQDIFLDNVTSGSDFRLTGFKVEESAFDRGCQFIKKCQLMC